EHVGAEDELGTGREVIGVVLHEGGTTGQPLPHDLRGAYEDRRLPVALRPEAVALGHEALDREPRELAQRAEVLEVRRERLRTERGQERLEGDLLARAVAQRLVAVPAAAQLGGDVVELLVLRDESRD